MINQIKEFPNKNCPVCGSKQLKIFFEMMNFPTLCNILWQSQDAARNCPKGNIQLAFCPICSFITNLAFEPALLDYSQSYDSSLHYSPFFKEYAHSLATRLIKRHNLYNKDIIEIGCGRGYFLLLLCKLGNNRGVGFDPSCTVQKNIDLQNQVKFIQDYYSEKYRNYQCDFIVCRHVLEHIPNPKEFLKTIRDVIGNRINAHVFFEMPNALQTFRRLFVWDIIYDHCSYFTPVSLSLIFSLSGFSVRELTEVYEGQFLCIDAIPDSQGTLNSINNQNEEVKKISFDIESFIKKYRIKVEKFRRKLHQFEEQGKRVVLWSAGSKGVTFLNTFKNSNIEYVVDINPNKQGMYIPGTGQKIVPPDFLKKYKPDVIIIMNPIYKNEIQELVNKLGLIAKSIYV